MTAGTYTGLIYTHAAKTLCTISRTVAVFIFTCSAYATLTACAIAGAQAFDTIAAAVTHKTKTRAFILTTATCTYLAGIFVTLSVIINTSPAIALFTLAGTIIVNLTLNTGIGRIVAVRRRGLAVAVF